MRIFPIVLLVYIALELAVFVLLGQQIGFLLTIAIYLLISIVGFSLSRNALARTSHKLDALTKQSLRAYINDQDLAQVNKQLALQRLTLSRRIVFFFGAMICFILPGFITEVIAVWLFIKGMSLIPNETGNLVWEESNSWLDTLLKKFTFIKTFSSYDRYRQEMQERYGKSERDLEREAEEAEEKRRAQSSVPEPDARAGQATVSEMKMKFQKQKEIKEAQYEEIHDEPQEQSSDAGSNSDSSFKA